MAVNGYAAAQDVAALKASTSALALAMGVRVGATESALGPLTAAVEAVPEQLEAFENSLASKLVATENLADLQDPAAALVNLGLVVGTDVVSAPELTSAVGAGLVGFSHSTSYPAGTLGRKAKNAIYVTDHPFLATGDGTTDDTAAIQAALTFAGLTGATVVIPAAAAQYKLTATLTVPANVKVVGEGYTSRLAYTGLANAAIAVGGDNVSLFQVALLGNNFAGGIGVDVSGAANVTVERCQINAFLRGVLVHGVVRDVYIRKNRLWGGTGDAVAAADITVYGTDGVAGTVRRAVVDGNFCLSNNDAGISAGTNNGDREVVVTNNVVIPCDASGVNERAADNNVKLRFGIIVGYVGTQEIRGVICGNLVRRAGYSGIYLQAAVSPAGTCAISGNLVSECGYSSLYPTDGSLRAGIYLAGGGADTVSGNVIVDCSGAGFKLSPTAGPGPGAPRSSITGNTIARTQGDGVVFANSPYGYLFAANRVYGSTGIAVKFDPTTPADSGDCVFTGNHIQTTGPNGAFQINAAGVAAPVVVANNVIVGNGDASTSVFNSGIYAGGSPDMLGIHSNVVRGYRLGIAYATAVNTRELDGPSNNKISDCYFGITGSGTGTLLCQGNTFKNVTEPTYNIMCNGVLLAGIYQISPKILTGNFDGAPPAFGAWDRGDQCMNGLPVAGGTPGWVCITAGSPGTWKAMAAIAA